MTDTTHAPITLDTLARLGQRRVNDTRAVYLPKLGGSVTLRQLSGADQDDALAIASADGRMDQTILAREQITRSMVDPELPAGEADAILRNLPYGAMGQLHAAVMANSGVIGIDIEDLVRSFRPAEDATRPAGGGEVDHHGADALDAVGLAGDDAAGDGAGEGVPSLDADGAGRGAQETGASVEAVEADGQVSD